jgi:hypothetical protein
MSVKLEYLNVDPDLRYLRVQLQLFQMAVIRVPSAYRNSNTSVFRYKTPRTLLLSARRKTPRRLILLSW